MNAATGQLSLNAFDISVFVGYIVVTIILGLWVARTGRNTAEGYFLGNKTIPWFVIGTSMVATDISTEHFISNVGGAYRHGLVMAVGDWNCWIIYSLLILVFLPYYIRTGLYTMPEFLERRYDPFCRYIFSIALIVGYVAAINAGALYAGGLMLEKFFNVDVIPSIVFFAAVTGVYTIYGGLKSAAWTDFMQMVVLMFAGVLVPVLALRQMGDIGSFITANPEHFHVIKPPTHNPFPFTGVFTGFLSVGIWYSCTSQHIVQRVLSAKDEWHARVGVVTAGFLHVILPFFFIIPGIIAFKLYPDLERADQAYLRLVQDLIPTGLKGLLLAGMAAALMSTLSTVLNSASTLVTMDIYKGLVNPKASERQQVSIGRWAGTLILVVSIWIAISFTKTDTPLFEKVQTVFFFIAPPFAVIFTMGILWRRANATAALATIILGFIFTALIAWNWGTQEAPRYALGKYNTFNHRALCSWTFSMLVMVVTSLLTPPPPKEKTEGIIWNKSYLSLPPDEQQRHRGLQDWRIWWLLLVVTVLAIYGFFIWRRIQDPW
jgi:SSS family solute:Na+ symporter